MAARLEMARRAEARHSERVRPAVNRDGLIDI
jgi:hypothetical protein